ncbi:MAG: acyl carrier protein [Mariprofundales bacterium]
MNRQRIETSLLTFFGNLYPEHASSLTRATPLLENLMLDSLAVVQATLFLETEFGIALQESDLNAETFDTIESLADLVTARLPAH